MESIRITADRMKVILPKEVQDSDALSDNEKKTLAAVMNYYAFFDKVKQQGYVYLSNKLLRGSVGIRQQLLLEAIQGLIEHGLIKREAGDASHRLASKYYVLWDNLKKPIKKLESDDIFASFYNNSEPSKTPMGTTDIDTDIDTDIVIEKEKEIDTVSVPVQEAVIETVSVSDSEIVSDSYLNNSLERKRSYIDNSLQEEKDNYLSLNNSLERKEEKDSNNVNVVGDTVPVHEEKKEKRKRSSTLKEEEDDIPFGGIADSTEYSTEETRRLKQQLLEESNVEIAEQRFLQPGSLLSRKVLEYKKRIERLQSLNVDGVRKYTDDDIMDYVTSKVREDTALSSDEVLALIETLSRQLALHATTP